MTVTRSLALLIACFMVVGASAPISAPIVVTGTVTKPVFTGWFRDWCSAGEPIDHLPGDSGCISAGGEIYRARLIHPLKLDGQKLARSMVIGFPAHALGRWYRLRTNLALQVAPKDLRDATGIEYLATDYGNYNQTQQCIVERGVAHTDFRLCADKKFHELYEGKCVPVAEFLRHYTEAPNNSFKPKPLRGSA